jgi:hypothetical protein
MYLQEWLFREALAEARVDHERLPIRVDHLNGRNLIGDVSLSLKYPAYFLRHIDQLDTRKTYKYVFRGFISPSGGRQDMLKRFAQPGSIVQHSADGRDERTKFQFQRNYFDLMKSGYFALCPNHKDWPGDPVNAWTYRFVEACFSRTLPVCFRDAPLGDAFVQGFECSWDDADHSLEDYDDKVERNRDLARQRFCLTREEIEAIQRGRG